MKQSPPIREGESQRNNYTDGYYYRHNDYYDYYHDHKQNENSINYV